MNSSDRLRLVDADFAEIGDQRRVERRRTDRRATRLRLDAGFATTLINQIAPAERSRSTYDCGPLRIRAGIAFDLKA